MWQRIQQLSINQWVGLVIAGVGIYWHDTAVIVAGLGVFAAPVKTEKAE